ncbi:MAG: 5'-nucleotidase C-terminal domain-containing protein [Bacteroidota bacterium]
MTIIFRSIIIAIFFFSSCTYEYQVVSISEESVPIDEDLISSEAGEKIIVPYRGMVESTMREVICTSNKPLIKGRPESELGNLVADLCLELAKEQMKDVAIDMCMMNTGGLRSSLPEGNITLGDVYQLMPFENELVVVQIDGKGMADLIHYLKASGGEPIAGLQLIHTTGGFEAKINNETFDENKTYTVLTSDYLANGGDRMHFFMQDERKSIQSVGMKLRDAIAIYFKRQGDKNEPLNPQLDGRLQIKE